jgi:hypothetical protein
MQKIIQQILAELPEKPARSRLEPYRALIEELRHRGWGYREIVGVLAEKCGLRTSVSNLHHFSRRAELRRKSPKSKLRSQSKEPLQSEAAFSFDEGQPLKLT